MARVTIQVGHSADPDDAFMVWALEADRVDKRGLDLEPVVSDIQTLNEWALEGRLEVTALSAGAYPAVTDTLCAAAARRVVRRGLRPDRGRARASSRSTSCGSSRSSRPGR